MRYPASEKLEIIRTVEQSHLPAKRTLDQLGIARRTFYRWYVHFLEGGPEALEDRPSAPSRVWNRIGDDIQDQIVEMALEETDLSPRELAPYEGRYVRQVIDESGKVIETQVELRADKGQLHGTDTTVGETQEYRLAAARAKAAIAELLEGA